MTESHVTRCTDEQITIETDLVRTRRRDGRRRSAATTSSSTSTTSRCTTATFRAVRDVDLTIRQHEITAFIGPSGCGKTHRAALLQPDERPRSPAPGSRARSRYHGVDLYEPDGRPRRGPPPDRHGVPEAEPVPEEHLRQRRLRPAARRHQEARASSTRSSSSSLRGAALWDEVKDRLKASALGLSGGQQQRLCIARAHRRRAGGDPDGRAVLGARPDRHRADRGPDAGDQAAVHDRHRHPQHAAGRAGQRPHCVLHHRGQRRERPPHRACSSSSAAPRRCSPTPTTNAPSSTSPGGSADGRAAQELPQRSRRRQERARPPRRVGHRGDPAGDGGAARRRPRGRRLHHPRRRRDRRPLARHRGALLPDPRPAGAGGVRPAPGRRAAEDGRRGRAVGTTCCATSARRRGGSTATSSTRSCAASSPGWASRPSSCTTRRSRRSSRTTRPRRPRSTTWTRYLDGLQKQFVQAIFESHAAGRIDLQVAVQLAVVARFYERIGDHAVNIGERVRLRRHRVDARARRAPTGYRQRVDATGELPGGAAVPDGDEPAVLTRRADRRQRRRRPRRRRHRDDAAERRRAAEADALRASSNGARRARRARRSASCSSTPTGAMRVRNDAAAPSAARGHGDVLVRGGGRATRAHGARRRRRRRADGRAVRPAAAGARRCTAHPLADGWRVRRPIDDISERARLDAVRTDFVANISHELKTPVGALAVLAEALADEDDLDGRAPARRQDGRRGPPRGADDRRSARAVAHRARRRSGSRSVDVGALIVDAVERSAGRGRAARHHASISTSRPTSSSVARRPPPARVGARQPHRQRGQVQRAGQRGRGRRRTVDDGWVELVVARHGHRHPGPRPRPDLRAVLPRRPGPQPGHRRHRPRPGDRAPRRDQPRRRGHGAIVEKARARRSRSAIPAGAHDDANMPMVLVVEDEESFVEALTIGLKREGFRVEVAARRVRGARAVRHRPARPRPARRDAAADQRHRRLPPAAQAQRRCRSSWSPPRAPRSTPSSGSRSAPTTTSPSRTASASWSPGCAPCCAATSIGRRRRRQTCRAARSSSATSPSTPTSTSSRSTAADVSLPLKEFELLHLLLANAGRVLPRETLIDRVWGSDYVGDTKTLDVHIKRLRGKIEPDPAAPDADRHDPRPRLQVRAHPTPERVKLPPFVRYPFTFRFTGRSSRVRSAFVRSVCPHRHEEQMLHTDEADTTSTLDDLISPPFNRRTLIGSGVAAGLATFLAGPTVGHAAADDAPDPTDVRRRRAVGASLARRRPGLHTPSIRRPPMRW